VVQDRPEARAIPSRNRLALFRLIALMRYRAGRTPSAGGPPAATRRCNVDNKPDQSTFENYALALLLFVVTSLYFAALVPRLAIIGPIAVGFLIQVPTYVTGLLLPKERNNQRVQSRMLFLLLIALSAWLATRGSWVRFVAFFVLGAAVLNAITAVVMLPFRRRLEALEP
jgi:hypothetical protein